MTGILSFLGWGFIRLLSMTLRVRAVNTFKLGSRSAAFAFWHGEQFILNVLHRKRGAVIMSSLSKDGSIQAGILERFNYTIVRGSSTRRGERALVEMIRLVRKGADAGFAVDGPRGPYKQVKPGILYLARKCGIPVIPVSCYARRTRVFDRAWDRYELPMPFSKAAAVYGAPIYVADGDDIERKTAELQRSLESLSAFSHKGYWSNDPGEYLSAHPQPKILIVQPSRIGDVVFTMPSVNALRKKYPNAWIGWITDERCAPVLDGFRAVDEVIVFDRRRLSPGYIGRTAAYLRSKNIDLSIDFHGLAKSAFLVLLAGAKFKLASSSTNGMRELSWLFSREISWEETAAHCVDRHFAVAEYLGCPQGSRVFDLQVSENDQQSAERILSEAGLQKNEPYAAIHPGGGWISRRWSSERYAALIDRLAKEAGLRAVLVGGREGGSREKGLNEEIKGLTGEKVIDLTGRLTLKELAAVQKKSRVFVANEAGPMHIASALGVPSVAILGPTDPSRTGPYGGETVIVRHEVECQPCRQRNCQSRKCMELVTVDEVFRAVKGRLSKV